MIEDSKEVQNNWQTKLIFQEEESKNRASEVEKLNGELEKLTKEISDSKKAYHEAECLQKSNLFKLGHNFLFESLKSAEEVIKDALNLLEDPILYKCTSSADYLIFKLHPFNDILGGLVNSYNKYVGHINIL